MPTADDYKKAIILTPGYAITYRSFRQTASRQNRTLMSQEYERIVNELVSESCGKIASFRVANTSKDCKVFIKQTYDQLPTELKNRVEMGIYEQKRTCNLPKAITPAMRDALELLI